MGFIAAVVFSGPTESDPDPNSPGATTQTALAKDVSYDVIIQTDRGALRYNSVKPLQARTNGRIYPARVGDPVNVYLSDGSVAFTVVEAIVQTPCGG